MSMDEEILKEEFPETEVNEEENLDSEPEDDGGDEGERRYAGKYKTVEEMERAHIEAQRKISETGSRLSELERQNREWAAYIQNMQSKPVQEAVPDEPEFESDTEKILWQQNQELQKKINQIQWDNTISQAEQAIERIEDRYKVSLDDGQKQKLWEEANYQHGTIRQKLEKAYKLLAFDGSLGNSKPVSQGYVRAPELESPGAPSPRDESSFEMDARSRAMFAEFGIDPRSKEFKSEYKKTIDDKK